MQCSRYLCSRGCRSPPATGGAQPALHTRVVLIARPPEVAHAGCRTGWEEVAHLRVWGGDSGQALERARRTVVVHLHSVQDRHVRAARAHLPTPPPPLSVVSGERRTRAWRALTLLWGSGRRVFSAVRVVVVQGGWACRRAHPPPHHRKPCPRPAHPTQRTPSEAAPPAWRVHWVCDLTCGVKAQQRGRDQGEP